MKEGLTLICDSEMNYLCILIIEGILDHCRSIIRDAQVFVTRNPGRWWPSVQDTFYGFPFITQIANVHLQPAIGHRVYLARLRLGRLAPSSRRQRCTSSRRETPLYRNNGKSAGLYSGIREDLRNAPGRPCSSCYQFEPGQRATSGLWSCAMPSRAEVCPLAYILLFISPTFS